MAVSLVRTYANKGTPTSSLAITISAAPTAGDLLLCAVLREYNVSVTTPSGWTLLDTTHALAAGGWDCSFSVYYKLASGAETTVTFALGASSYAAGWYAQFTGNGTSAPQSSTFNAITTSGTTSQTAATISGVPSGAISVNVGGYAMPVTFDRSVASGGSGWSLAQESIASGVEPCFNAFLCTNTTGTGSVTSSNVSVTSTTIDSGVKGSFYIGPPTNLGGLMMGM